MPGNPGCLGVRWHWTSPAASANRGSQSSRARGLQVSEWLVVGVRTGSAWPCGCKERNRLGRQAAPRDLCESCCCRRYAGLAPPAPPLHATPCTTRSPETGRPGRAPPVGPPNRDACTCNAPCKCAWHQAAQGTLRHVYLPSLSTRRSSRAWRTWRAAARPARQPRRCRSPGTAA